MGDTDGDGDVDGDDLLGWLLGLGTGLARGGASAAARSALVETLPPQDTLKTEPGTVQKDIVFATLDRSSHKLAGQKATSALYTRFVQHDDVDAVFGIAPNEDWIT
jgi:hypothetical protein